MSDTIERLPTTVRELTVDVKNPTKDGRSRDWHKLPVVPKGTRLFVRETPGEYKVIRRAGKYGIDTGWETSHDKLGKLLIENSEEVEPTSFVELMEVSGCDWGADEVLRILVKLGRITRADFEAVAEAPGDL